MITDILLNCQLEKLPSNALCKPIQRSGYVYLPIAAHFSFSQTFSSSFRRGLSIS